MCYDIGGYTVQEILASFCEKILEIIDQVNKNEEVCDDTNRIIENIRNKDVPDLVDDIIKDMEDNGYFDNLVNVTLIDNLRTELTTLLNQTITEHTTRLDNFNSQLNVIENKVKLKNIRTVAKTGGEYHTIMDAVNAGGDTIENPITIKVAPATYKESVVIKQWTRLNLVGEDKTTCIIRQDHGLYENAPLETCGERYIANLTFIATHDDNPTLDINLQKSYAFHGDKSSGGDGTTLVENCRFESYQNASVGLGIYNNQTFHFKNCEFYSKIDWNSPQANIGAFFAHNNAAGGETNGKLILENCTFFMDNDRSGYGHACYINDANLTDGDGSGNAINVKFINCTLKRRVGEHINAIRLDNTTSINNLSGTITLDKISNGNNISQLNFPQLNWVDVTLTSPIANVGSSFTPLRYSKDINGKVRIEGTLKGLTSGSTNTLFTLPVGYRPKYHMFYDIVNYKDSTLQIGKLLVNRNGNVTIEGTLNTDRNDICVEFYAEQ